MPIFVNAKYMASYAVLILPARATASPTAPMSVILRSAAADAQQRVAYVDITITFVTPPIAQGQPFLKIPLLTSNVVTVAKTIESLSMTSRVRSPPTLRTIPNLARSLIATGSPRAQQRASSPFTTEPRSRTWRRRAEPHLPSNCAPTMAPSLVPAKLSSFSPKQTRHNHSKFIGISALWETIPWVSPASEREM